MTTAVLLAAGAEPAVLTRLVEQLRGLGVEDLHVIESGSAAGDLRAVARLAADGEGPFVVAHGDILTHRSAIDGLLTDPRVGSGILASSDGGKRAGGHGVRSDRGRVLSMGSAYHAVSAPNNSFLGMVKVSGTDREALADVAQRLTQVDGLPEGDLPALLGVGLVRSGVHLNQAFLGRLYWARPQSREELDRASEEIAGIDEESVLLDSAVKPQDGFFTTFFVSPYSKYIARWAARRGFTPNQVTTFSMLIGVAAAVAFGFGTRAGLVAGAVLLQIAFTFDCVDGQLARYTRTFTKLGAWLDSVFDRAKEYAVFAGLAIGAGNVWVLAGAALTFQTVRHGFDFSFAASEHKEFEEAPQRPLDEPSDGGAQRPIARRANSTLTAWQRLNRLPGVVWVKRMLPFPIGERFAVISVTAALFTPRTTFIVLLAWGAVAAVYTLAGRVLRSIR